MTGVSLSCMHERFWITPRWPRGYCPIHTWEGGQCSGYCAELRAAFGDVARETQAYFESVLYRRLVAA